MTSKERMLRALAREKPDRLPVTIHQWQQYHLDTYLGGMDALAAFKTCGLDASIQYFEAMGQFWIPNAEKFIVSTPEWREEIEVVKDDPNDKLLNHTITTPGGQLTYKTGGNRTTTWITEYLIKKHEDVELIEKYMPVAKLNKQAIAARIRPHRRRRHPARVCLGRSGRLLAARLLPDGGGAVDPGVHGPSRLGASPAAGAAGAQAAVHRGVAHRREVRPDRNRRRRRQRHGDFAEAAPRILPALRPADPRRAAHAWAIARPITPAAA